MSAAPEIDTVILPRPNGIPKIADASISVKPPTVQAAGERHCRQDSESSLSQLPNNRDALRAKDVVIDHHRYECGQPHDVLYDIHLEAIYAQVADFAFLPQPDKDFKQSIGQVRNLRTVQLQQRDGIKFQVPQAPLHALPDARRRPILVRSAPFVELCSDFGCDDQIVSARKLGERASEPRFGIAAGITRTGVEECHPALCSGVHEPNRIRLAEYPLAPEARATESDFGNTQPGTAKRAI